MSPESWYLDCYHHAALLGDQFPVNSFGPASLDDVEELNEQIRDKFHRTEITQQTKGLNPRSRDRWYY